MSTPTHSNRGLRSVRVLGALLVLATALAYSNSLHAPFVYDDVLAIPANPTIRKLWRLTDVLLPQSEGGLTVSGRPVLNLSFALNHAISGTAVWSYHLFNLIVHTAAGLLLFGLVRRTLLLRHPLVSVAASASEPTSARFDASTLPAFAIALLWLLHPLQTQAVTYTVQRAESLTGFFYLLTLHGFVRAGICHLLNDKLFAARTAGAGGDCHLMDDNATRASRWWLAGSVAACVLGMGTKETMATAPLVVLLFDRTFVAGSFRAALRARSGYYLALVATWIPLAALVLSTGGNRGGTAGLGVGVPLWAYPLTQFEAISRYLGLSLWPHPLIFEYGTFWVQRAADLVPYALVVLPLLVATGFALRRRSAPAFLGAAFFLILAPTSLTPGTIQMIVEHRMYLPLAAVMTAAVLLAQRVVPQRLATAALISVAIAFGALTFARNHDYRSHLALWSDTVAKRPNNPRACEGLAEAWGELGRHDLAAQHRAESIRLQPDASKSHYNLGVTRMEAGQLAEAVRSFELALRLTPDEPRAHNNLAIVLGRLGRSEEALAHYAEAIRLKPDDAQYRYNFGVALLRVGKTAEAVEQFEATLRLQPDHADAHFNLAGALVRMRQLDESVRHYREAVRLRPDDAEYRANLGGALLMSGDPAAAEVEFRRAVTLKPDSIDAHFGLGNALAARRRSAEAIPHYEAVLRQQPDHGNAQYKLGNALLDVDRAADATSHYEAAIRLLPNDAEAHHNLGVAYARQERWDDARREFETALRLKPDYADARRNLDQLRALLGR